MNIIIGKSYWYRSRNGNRILSTWGKGRGCAVVAMANYGPNSIIVRKKGKEDKYCSTQYVRGVNLIPMETTYTQLSFNFE